MGHRILIHGVLEVTEVGDTVSYANVLKVYENIKPGELLTPYREGVEPLSANSVNNFLEGYIVATKLDKIGVGITDIRIRENLLASGRAGGIKDSEN